MIIIIEDLGYPAPAFWFLEGVMPSNNRLLNLGRFLKVYLQRSLGSAAVSDRATDEVEAIISGGRTARMLPYLGIGNDAADGCLRLREGAIDIDWSHRASRRPLP